MKMLWRWVKNNLFELHFNNFKDGELVSEDEKSTNSDVREETPKVEPYAPFFRTIDKNESRRCKTAFDKNTTVEEDFFAEEREKK